MRALLRHGANPDAVVEHGTPGRRFGADYSIRHQAVGANAFWLASMYGELEILRVLAEHGADPLVTPATGASSLQAALGVPMMARENRRNRVGAPPTDTADEERRSLEMVRLVLDRGVDVNASDARGNTALHDAVRRRFPSVVEFLAENGADLDAGNKDGSTPLMLAESQQAALRHQRPEWHARRHGRSASAPWRERASIATALPGVSTASLRHYPRLIDHDSWHECCSLMVREWAKRASFPNVRGGSDDKRDAERG